MNSILIKRTTMSASTTIRNFHTTFVRNNVQSIGKKTPNGLQKLRNVYYIQSVSQSILFIAISAERARERKVLNVRIRIACVNGIFSNEFN